MALFAEYLLEEGAGPVLDSSGNGRNLTVAGGTYVTPGKDSGFAFQSGAGGTNGAAANMVNPTAAITLMAWVAALNVSPAHRVVATFANGGSTMAALFTRRNDFGPGGVVQGNLRIAGNVLTLNGGAVWGADPLLPLGTFVHIAMTFDGTTRILYINGVVVDSQVAAGTIGVGADFAIAGSNDNPNAADAQVDDVRVFDTALTQSEIQAIIGSATPAEGTITIPLSLALTATGSAPHSGTTTIPLTLATAATGETQHQGSAPIPLTLGLSPMGATTPQGTAEIALSLAFTAVGDDGEATENTAITLSPYREHALSPYRELSPATYRESAVPDYQEGR